MNIIKKALVSLTLVGVALFLAACERRPMEKAGKAIDDAVDRTRDKINERK